MQARGRGGKCEAGEAAYRPSLMTSPSFTANGHDIQTPFVTVVTQRETASCLFIPSIRTQVTFHVASAGPLLRREIKDIVLVTIKDMLHFQIANVKPF